MDALAVDAPAGGETHISPSRSTLPAAGIAVSLVVPTFNESENVVELLWRIEATLGATGWEIIFVDDDSPDGTAEPAASLNATRVCDASSALEGEDCLRRASKGCSPRRGRSSA